MRFERWLIVVLGLLCAGLARAQAKPELRFEPADGRYPSDWGDTVALMRRQAALVEAATFLARKWGAENPYGRLEGEIGPTGFAGFEIDPERGTVLLSWKYGIQIPASIATDIADAAARPGVLIEVLKSPFSAQDLRDELYLFRHETMDDAELEIVSIGPTRGALGLAVQSKAPAKVLASAAYKNLLARLKARSKKPPELPVSVTKPDPSWVFMSRGADTSPYWGGAEILNNGPVVSSCSATQVCPAGFTCVVGRCASSGCTSGFAVGNLFGKYLLTAGHCSTWTNNVWFSAAARTVGYTWGAVPIDSFSRTRLDTILLVNLLNPPTNPDSVSITPPGSSEGIVYAGEVSVDELARRVKDHSDPMPGMLVCSSGSQSGERCGLRVVSVGQVRNLESIVPVRNLADVVSDRGTNAGGKGDSGGPLYSLTADMSGVIALGVLVGLDENRVVPCTNIIQTGNTPRTCASAISVQPFMDARTEYDVRAETK